MNEYVNWLKTDREPKKPRKGLKPVSEKRAEERKVWALIKKSMLLAQLRTNGHTSCMECGEMNPEPIDLDHMTPSGRGGAWTPDNAQLLCRGCHSSKHGRVEWSKP